MQDILNIQNKDPTFQNITQEKQLHLQLQELLKRKDMIWQQKSRELWLKEEDMNTKFFHLSAVIKGKLISINAVKSESNQWIYEYKEIAKYFIENFKSLFTSTNPNIPKNLEVLIHPRITDEENIKLMEIPTGEEIEAVIKSMSSLKSSRPDGMPALFYKKVLEYNKR